MKKKYKAIVTTITAIFVFVALVILAINTTKPTGKLADGVMFKFYHAATDDDYTDLPSGMIASDALNFGEYSFGFDRSGVQEIYSNWYCSSNTCSGVETSKDDLNCSIYTGTCLANYRDWRSTCKQCWSPYCGCGSPQITGCTCNMPRCDSGWYGGGCGDWYQPSYSCTCGGKTRDSLGYRSNCFQKIQTYKNGVLINTSDYLYINFKQDFDDGRLIIDFNTANQWHSDKCYFIENTVYFNLKEDDIIPQYTIEKLENGAKITLSATNNYKPYQANYSIQTISKININGQDIEFINDQSEIIQLDLGETTLIKEIILNNSPNKITILPRLDIIQSTSELSSLNVDCYGDKVNTITQPSYCRSNYVLIDQFNGTATEINFTDPPKPPFDPTLWIIGAFGLFIIFALIIYLVKKKVNIYIHKKP